MTHQAHQHLPSIEFLLKKYHLRPQKHWGQNFLTAKPILEKIIKAAAVSATDDVLEIGPGLGVLTAMLAQQAHAVYAVEKDRLAAHIIQEEFGSATNIKLIIADFLHVDLKTALPEARLPLKVVGNIPYNISTPILFKLLDHREMLSSATLTVQKEVAQRIVAIPDNKDYGILSIMLQARASCHKLFDIKPTCFLPPPKVTSSVIKIDYTSQPNLGIPDFNLFEKLVKAAFGQRRKTIRNALLGAKEPAWNKDKIEKALLSCKIDSQRRPETISIVEYARLANEMGSV